MKFTARSVWSPPFMVEWTAPSADSLHVGMPSTNHRSVMRMQANELTQFRAMAREGKTRVVQERWVLEVTI